MESQLPGKSRKRGRRVALFALAAGLVTVLSFLFAFREEVEDLWIARRLDSPEEEDRAEALKRLVARRSPWAIPRLLELYEQDGEIPSQLEYCLGGDPARAVRGLEAYLQRGEGEPALLGAGKLLALRPESRAAREALQRLLATGEIEIREKAFQALEEAGVDTAGSHLSLLAEADPEIRRVAACHLGQIGPQARHCGPRLAAHLRDPALIVRVEAAWALVHLGSDDEAGLLAAVVEGLGSTDHHALRSAADAVRVLGKERARDALPRLAQGLAAARGMDPFPEAFAVFGAEAVPHLTPLLRNEEESVRSASLLALRAIGPAARGAIPALRAALSGPDLGLADLACDALLKIAEPSDAARVLGDALGKVEPGAAGPLLRALTRLGRGAAGAVPVVLPFLEDPAAEVRGAAASALAAIGSPPEGAMSRLAQLREDPEPAVHLQASAALLVLDPRREEKILPPLLQSLRAAMSDRHWPVEVVAALETLGPRAAPLGAEVAKAYLEGIAPTRAVAAIGEAALAPALEALDLEARDGEGLLRRLRALALFREIGPCPSALPRVVRALKDPLSRVRINAAWALTTWGRAAAPAVPALEDLARDRWQLSRTWALEALRRIQASEPRDADRRR